MIDDDDPNTRLASIDLRHKNKPLTSDEKLTLVRIKDLGMTFLREIEENLPSGHEAAIARTKINEAVAWAVKALTA